MKNDDICGFVENVKERGMVDLNDKRPETFEDTISKIADEIKDTLDKKNADYGSSFEKTMHEYGEKALIIRLSDKLERLKAIDASRTLKVSEEKAEDTIQDIAGYCILRLALARRGR